MGHQERIRLSIQMARSMNWSSVFCFFLSWQASSDWSSRFSPLQNNIFNVSLIHTVWAASVQKANLAAVYFPCQWACNWLPASLLPSGCSNTRCKKLLNKENVDRPSFHTAVTHSKDLPVNIEQTKATWLSSLGYSRGYKLGTLKLGWCAVY